MNTARKGRKYEVEYREILRSVGYVVTRAAASKGPFDLIAYNAVRTIFIACSLRRTSCAYARSAARTLRELVSNSYVRYVHPTKESAYCVHEA